MHVFSRKRHKLGINAILWLIISLLHSTKMYFWFLTLGLSSKFFRYQDLFHIQIIYFFLNLDVLTQWWNICKCRYYIITKYTGGGWLTCFIGAISYNCAITGTMDQILYLQPFSRLSTIPVNSLDGCYSGFVTLITILPQDK